MLETIEKYWKETEIYMYIWSALLVVMGILLIVKPDFVMTFISCLIGIVMVVGGISSIIQFFAIGKDETGNYPVRKIIIGILLIIIGIYIVARPQILVSIAACPAQPMGDRPRFYACRRNGRNICYIMDMASCGDDFRLDLAADRTGPAA